MWGGNMVSWNGNHHGQEREIGKKIVKNNINNKNNHACHPLPPPTLYANQKQTNKHKRRQPKTTNQTE